MTRSINDQKTWNLELEGVVFVDNLGFRLNGIDGEIRSTNLLGDTSSFTLLHIGLSNLVQQFRLTSIDVPENTADRRSEVVL